MRSGYFILTYGIDNKKGGARQRANAMICVTINARFMKSQSRLDIVQFWGTWTDRSYRRPNTRKGLRADCTIGDVKGSTAE